MESNVKQYITSSSTTANFIEKISFVMGGKSAKVMGVMVVHVNEAPHVYLKQTLNSVHDSSFPNPLNEILHVT